VEEEEEEELATCTYLGTCTYQFSFVVGAPTSLETSLERTHVPTIFKRTLTQFQHPPFLSPNVSDIILDLRKPQFFATNVSSLKAKFNFCNFFDNFGNLVNYDDLDNLFV
jgi:hypothetical protein